MLNYKQQFHQEMYILQSRYKGLMILWYPGGNLDSIREEALRLGHDYIGTGNIIEKLTLIHARSIAGI